MSVSLIDCSFLSRQPEACSSCWLFLSFMDRLGVVIADLTVPRLNLFLDV